MRSFRDLTLKGPWFAQIFYSVIKYYNQVRNILRNGLHMWFEEINYCNFYFENIDDEKKILIAYSFYNFKENKSWMTVVLRYKSPF